MMKNEKTTFDVKEFLQAHRHLWWVALLALLGIALLLAGSGDGEGETASAVAPSELDVMLAYKVTLERELTALCDDVAGVSGAEVVVTLAHGSCYQYATDADGDVVRLGSGNGSTATVTVSPPAVAGVGIVCRGGNDPRVQRELTSLVSTTLGISTARIFVSGK